MTRQTALLIGANIAIVLLTAILIVSAFAQNKPAAQDDICIEKLQIQQYQVNNLEIMAAQLLKQNKKLSEELDILRARLVKPETKSE